MVWEQVPSFFYFCVGYHLWIVEKHKRNTLDRIIKTLF
jgi:hypothetical protein